MPCPVASRRRRVKPNNKEARVGRNSAAYSAGCITCSIGGLRRTLSPCPLPLARERGLAIQR